MMYFMGGKGIGLDFSAISAGVLLALNNFRIRCFGTDHYQVVNLWSAIVKSTSHFACLSYRLGQTCKVAGILLTKPVQKFMTE